MRKPRKRSSASLTFCRAFPPLIFKFHEDAQSFWELQYTLLQNRIRGKLPAHLASHLSKYAGLLPSLALLFELAERAGTGTPKQLRSPPRLPDPKDRGLVVGFANLERAHRLCELLEQHARRFYGCSTPEQWSARLLARKLQLHPEIETFTAGFVKD
jgi:hypothetical protein